MAQVTIDIDLPSRSDGGPDPLYFVAKGRFMFGRPLPATMPQALAGAGVPPIRVLLDGLEVTQSVQNMQHSVPLVAGKATVVRAYLSVESAGRIDVRGELAVGPPGSATIAVYSSNMVTLDPGLNGQLRPKREDVKLSLNFSLPAAQTVAGSLEVRLAKVTQVSTGGALVIGGAAGGLVAQFVSTPLLRVRILGLRYSAGASATTYEPTDLDYALIESWLRRAYPVSGVVLSRAVVNSNYTWPFDADQTNAQVAAIRRLDMASGGDGRVHYFGLVADGGGANFMRGKAAGIPQAPDPTTVASGPTGSNTWGWDFDGSYGDWYTGHELAHTFGRYHPGFCNGNSADDPQFPYPGGQISPSTGEFVGFDVGDSSHGIAAAALPGVKWHDVMTYCDYQWLSAYTYVGVRDRIVAEDPLPAAPDGGGNVPGPAPGPQGGGSSVAPPSQPVAALRAASGRFLNVLATVNLTKQTGEIQFVQPLDAAHLSPVNPDSSTRLRVRNQAGSQLRDEPVELRLGSCPMPGEDRSGLVDAILPHDPEAWFIDLLLNGMVLDTYAASAAQPSVSNLRRMAAAQPASLALAWDAQHAPASTVTYSVQVSTDDGKTWQTVAVHQPAPTTEVDLRQFRPMKRLLVRVIATDGFRSHVTAPHEITLD
jgi:hypothetical protein